MTICERICHLFDTSEAADAWWQQTLCRLYTTACQLWHVEDEAVVLLYGGAPIAVESRSQFTGVVRRLERRLDSGWRPESVEALEGFLWSRLRYEYKTLLCLTSGIPRWQPLSHEILEVLGSADADPAVRAESVELDAEERQTRAAELGRVRAALHGKPKLLELLEAVLEEVLASEDADEDVTAEGWRKRVLRRVGDRLGLSQAALHQRLRRIRAVWEQVRGE